MRIRKMQKLTTTSFQFESDLCARNEVEAHIRIMEPVIRYLACEWTHNLNRIRS